MDKIAVVIPSLNPDDKLLRVTDKLIAADFPLIIVVNDGSGEAHTGIFSRIALLPGCHVLVHELNRGKGRALKTAFSYLREHFPDVEGVVTVDGDAQHQAEDVAACAAALKTHPDSLILGVRDFDDPLVPWRSRMGNRITCFVFRAFCRLKVTDTQTGLRCIPGSSLEFFCRIPGERFEYETNMLLYANGQGIPVAEHKISTVYLEGNASSHFRVLRDSMLIYGAILRFALHSPR